MDEKKHFNAEKYETSLNALINDYQGFSELTPAQKEDLITVFGCPKVEVKSPEAIRPPSPSESITTTQNNLKKLKEKGFLHSTETDDFDQQLLQRKLFEYKAENKQKKDDDDEVIDIESTITSDPEMKRWLQTNTVQSVIKEFHSLPFIDGLFLYQTLNRFYFAITGYVRKQQTLRPKRLSNQYLHDEMYNFVIETQKLRSELLNRAITNNMIFIKKMNPKYLVEFKDAIADLKVKLEATRQNLLIQQKQEEEMQKHNKRQDQEKDEDEEKKEKEKKGPKRGQENFDILDDIAIDEQNNNNNSNSNFVINTHHNSTHHSKAQDNDLSFLEHAKGSIDPMPFVYEMNTDYFNENYLKQQEKQMISVANNITEKYPYQNLIISKQTSASTNQLLPLNEQDANSNLRTPSNIHKKSYSTFTKKPFSILGYKPPVKIVVPQVQPKMNKKSNSALDFWISNDPLSKNRDGKPVDIFHQFENLTNIEIDQNDPDPEECSNFPHLMVQDYRPPTAVIVDDKDAMITDRIWSTSQMADPSLPPIRDSSKANSQTSANARLAITQNDSSVTFTTNEKTLNPYTSQTQLSLKNQKDKSNDEPTFNGFTADQLMQNGSSVHNSETFKYLLAHTPFDSDKIGATSRQFAILQSYMAELGFNTYQKLELYKKYSSNVELMSKISEYLPYWQHAIDSLNTFEKNYHELRTYMETCLSITEAEPFLKASYSNLDMASNTLQEAGDRLKQLTDDTLFLRGKNYLDYIERKKKKIQQIKHEREQEEILEKQKEKQKPKRLY